MIPLSEMPEEQRNTFNQNVKDYVSELKDYLGKQPSFDDFIKDYIDNTENGKSKAKELFANFREAWKANGYPEADYRKTFNELLSNRKNIGEFLNTIGTEIVNPTQLREANEKSAKDVIKKTSAIVGIDSNNRPIVKDDTPFRASDAKLRAAYLSITYNTDITINEMER